MNGNEGTIVVSVRRSWRRALGYVKPSSTRGETARTPERSPTVSREGGASVRVGKHSASPPPYGSGDQIPFRAHSSHRRERGWKRDECSPRSSP